MKARLQSLITAARLLMTAVCCGFILSTPAYGQTVIKQLYLSDPGQSLDRMDPVATADITTTQSAALTPSAQYLYALRGGSRIDFWRYNIAGNTWNAMANTPGTVSRGGALASNGSFIYALRGASTDFWRYNPAGDTWSAMASTPSPVSGGAALVHVNGAIYAFAGGSTTTFWKYSIATNTWTVMAPAPSSSTVDWGGSLTTNGTDIFALRGSGTSTFWKYTVATNTWSVMAALSMGIDGGGSLGFDGTSVYALRGGNFNSSYKYNVSTNTWVLGANTPNPVFKGGALISDDQLSYALRGNNSKDFWSYNGTAWSVLSSLPSNVDSGGAIIKLGTTGKTTSFTQTPILCSPLTIKAGTITISNYISLVYGSMPANPAITATLKYGATTIITLSNPVYNSGTGLLTWTGTLPADVTIATGQAITLVINTLQTDVSFKIEYDSQTKPSRIDLPVSTFINVNSIGLYTAAYPVGTLVSNSLEGSTRYIRATVTDPFGYADIRSLNVTVTPGSTTAGTTVYNLGCTKIFQTTWVVPMGATTYNISATAKEGYENTVTHTNSVSISTCLTCPPTAYDDIATGNGGEPLDVDVFSNDTDPNNNIDSGSLTIISNPKNGDAIIDNNKITYLPNGTFTGNDTLVYQICDRSTPAPLCATARVIVNILPVTFNICGDASKSKIYYMPYAENEAQLALARSADAAAALPTTNIRTIISLKISYPGIKLIWDHWEDGYEADILNPLQSTTEVWGDGNIFNGAAPGYPTDVIPAGGNIVLDNTMPTPRVVSNRFYDGKDKLYSSGQISVTQVCGEPSTIAVQCMKTNVSAYPSEFGELFTLPVGQNLPSRDFRYTALFVRASQNNTYVEIDRDADGDFETKFTLNEGQVMLVDSTTAPAGTKVLAGAVITADKSIGLDAHFSGIDGYSSREIPIFPATWYSNVYYTPVPTTGPGTTAPLDTAVVMLYNSLNRPININWSSGDPASGTIALGANSSFRFAMPLSTTSAYKFVNPTKESFVAIEIVDSYTPGGGGNDGATRDWAFNLISEARLTDFASVAWAPGSTNMTRNDNPIWVTPSANTTLYVKYDGDVSNGPNTSPCGLKFDIAMPLNALNYVKIKDASDNNQSGTAVYTCNGAKIAAVYGEDPETALAANPSWDVGSTIQPFCKEKLIFANTDNAVTLINTPVNIEVLKNDAVFMGVINIASVTAAGLLQPANGTVTITSAGSIIYTPNTAFVGLDSFQYNVCTTPTPVICATAIVYVTIGACPSPTGMNIITGQVFMDKNQDGVRNDGGTGISPAKIYLYVDGNCNNSINTNELIDSVNVDINGYYQFVRAPEKIIADNFDLLAGGSSCASGSDGSASWRNDWKDNGDASSGFCVTPAPADADVEIVQDSTFGFALRLDDISMSAIREFSLEFATQAYLSFSYRKASTALSSNENVQIQLSSDGSTYNTIYTIWGNNTYDPNYVNISNLSINTAAYNGSNKTFLRIITNSRTDEGDLVFIDNISIKFLQYDQCYMLGLVPSSIPANTALTTASLQSFKFSTSGTCGSSLDFGVKRMLTYTVNDENSTWKDVNVSGVISINDFDQESNMQNFGSFLHPSTKATIASGAMVSGTDKTGAAVANAGTLVFNATGKYTFDPSPAFTGTVSIPYRICDNGIPSACDTAMLVITVDPLPGAGNSVIANNDENISYGSAVSGNLFVNDRDPKYLSFTAILFTYDSNGDGIPDINTTPGTVTIAGIDIYGKPVPNAGKLTINADGTYTYTPAAGFTGSIDAGYTISNTAGTVAAASLHIDVLADINGTQNDPPFAGDDFGYTTTGQPVTASYVNNDSDPNADSLSMNGTFINTAGPANPVGIAATTTQGGTVQFYSNGTYTYMPPAGYTGPDLITYSVCDITTRTPQPLCANASLHLLVAPGISISGKVWDDADGNVTDAGAAEPETNAGGSLYVNLVDAMGYVVAAVPVANDGTYSLSNVAPGVGYSLILSTTEGNKGSMAPAPDLPVEWISTGETRNGIIDFGAMGIIDNRAFGFTSLSNFDFGIEQLPNSDKYDTKIKTPTIGLVLTLNGGTNPPVLSGSDPEDCKTGCSSSGRSVLIEMPPLNANLYYNGALVNAGQVLSNFNPSLLKIEFTAVTVGSVSTEFSYSFIDAAGKSDPTPALYSLNWFSTLPVSGLNLAAARTGTEVALNWKTITEINSDYFEVERSTDSRKYIKIGGKIKAAGNTAEEKQYRLSDDISEVSAGTMVYYRIIITDISGKKAYSNVAIIKLPANGSIKVMPNPFVSEITISMSVDQNTVVAIRMLDMSGRAIMSTSQKVTKELPQVNIKNLGMLNRGVYVVEVTDLQSGKKGVAKIEKTN